MAAMYVPEIIHEDNHLLVVRKPPGLLSQGDKSGDPDLLSLCKEYLRVRDEKPGQAWLGLVQRLDRPTGGVMCFAKTSKAAARVSEAFRLRQVQKDYLLVTQGVIAEVGSKLTYEDRLSKDAETNKSRVLGKQDQLRPGEKKAREARMVLEVLAVDRGVQQTLARVDLITGRSHQIRVQLAERGHPLVGDRKYGSAAGGPRRAGELALWANRLELPHPTTKERLVFWDWPSGAPWEGLLTRELRERLEAE